jgi:hypothetical protein
MEMPAPQPDVPESAAPSRRRVWVEVCILALVLLGLSFYVGSYYRLSRRGMAEADDAFGVGLGFLYTPISEAIVTPDFSKHRVLRAIYTPLNWIDRQLFEGRKPDGDLYVVMIRFNMPDARSSFPSADPSVDSYPPPSQREPCHSCGHRHETRHSDPERQLREDPP